METIILENDIEVICVKAFSFPDGIQDAHDRLRTLFPPTVNRRYFGISYPQQGGIVYRAATDHGASLPPGTELFSIRKGTYACMTLYNYYKDLPNVTNTFQQLLSHPNLDPKGYCLEWYLSDKDVRCMVKLGD
jgi:hypothetical protein